ncbi:hypothetical protein LQW54_001388 [Pestalotiopsis sp. IQ-011]
MSPYYGKPSRTITSFHECDDKAKTELRRFFTLWPKHHVESPKAITEEKLKEIVDRLVFDVEFWDSSLPPVTPKFEKPKFNTNTVRIGVFSKDLPDPKKVESMFDHEQWDELLLVFLRDAPRYKVRRVRKTGQPAVLRTRLDKIGQKIVFEYFDTEGRYAPANYIDFGTGPTTSQMMTCHATPWDPEEENEKRNWDERFFLRAPSIIKELPKIQERLAKLQRMTSDEKIQGPFGSLYLNVRSEPEPESEIKPEIESETKSESKLDGESGPEVQSMRKAKRKFDSFILE